ncbi:hypothetical protein V8B55DRAFT_1460671 [Mucor lusitanicus]
MPIKTLIHNLKLLGFDESKHGKGVIKLNKKLFTHEAINNDKALEYICLFLFRKVDKLRVKKELLPTLTVHTYASRQHFIARVYKWLWKFAKKTIFSTVFPLRKSELSAYQGANLVKVMLALSTYVLQSTMKHTDVGNVATMLKPAIENSIVQANQVFDLNTETNNTYVSKAAKAAKEISAELSSSPPPPPSSPSPSDNTIPVESQPFGCLNEHLQSIIHNLNTNVSNVLNQESNVVEEPFASASCERSTSVQRSSDSLSFESLRALEESSTSFIAEQPRIVESPSSPVTPDYSEEVNEPPTAMSIEQPTSPAIPEYSEEVNEPPTTVSIEQPSTVEESSIPVIFDYPDTVNAPSSTLFTEQSTYMEEPTSLVNVEEPNTVVTASNTSLFYAAASSVPAAEGPTYNYATEPEVPNIDSSKAKGSTINIYMPEGSRMITTPNYIPRSFTPDDEQRDVPNAPRKIAQPKPRATTPNTNFTQPNTSFTSRNTIHYPSAPSVLPPMQLNYIAESCQLPPLRQIIQDDSYITSLHSPFWFLPAIPHTTASPRTESVSPPSPSSAF